MSTVRISRAEALERIRHHIRQHPPEAEICAVATALGRISAQDLFAAHSTPSMPRSSVDGFALRSSETRGASETTPVRLRISGEVRPSTPDPQALAPHAAVEILTGGGMPPGADCVLPIEEAVLEDGALRIAHERFPLEHVRPAGSDLQAGTRIARRGEELSPVVLAALAVSGVTQAQVFAQLRARVLAVGNELTALDAAPEPGRMPADNLLLAAGLLHKRGLGQVAAEVCPNDPEELARRLADGQGGRLLITTGGTGPGRRDFIMEAARRAGFAPLFQGLRITPGKSALAAVKGDRLLFGLPGTPWAVFTLMHALVLPSMCWLRGRVLPEPGPILARPTAALPAADPGWERLVPCTISALGAELQAQPLLDRTRESRLDMLDAQGLLLAGPSAQPDALVPMIPIWENRRGHKLD